MNDDLARLSAVPLAAAAEVNARAVEALRQQARALAPARWTAPRAPGKWAPFEEVRHVARSYTLFAGALTGAYAFTRQVPEEQSLALRRGVLPRILASDWFPSGAETVADARPAAEPASAEVVLAELDAAVHAFGAALAAVDAAGTERTVRHAYFGDLPIPEFVLVAAAHTRHHARMLSGA